MYDTHTHKEREEEAVAARGVKEINYKMPIKYLGYKVVLV
jgi:hypothetical protein